MVRQIDYQDYEEILQTYFDYYIQQFGERKYISIIEKCKTSNKISQLVKEAKVKNVMPNHIDILTCINTIPYFMFSSGQTQALAALMTLEFWNQDANYQENISEEYLLKIVAINIIKKSVPTFN